MAHLKPGDTIGIFSPSSYVEPEQIEPVLALIESKGYKVFIHGQTYKKLNQSAGTHEEKLQALHDLYSDPEIKALWASGGGNRALHLLEDINYKLLKKNPKPIIGFSDTTALLNAFYHKAGIQGLHAPVLTKLAGHKHAQETFAMLAGEDIELPLKECKVIKPGKAKGKMIGGNLSVFINLIHTLYKPEDLKGHILFLEDCNEEYSHLDRKLIFLRQTGALSQCEGLILGAFSGLKDTGRPYGFTLEEMIKEHTNNIDIPVVVNAPFGHADNLFPIRLGTPYSFDTATI